MMINKISLEPTVLVLYHRSRIGVLPKKLPCFRRDLLNCNIAYSIIYHQVGLVCCKKRQCAPIYRRIESVLCDRWHVTIEEWECGDFVLVGTMEWCSCKGGVCGSCGKPVSLCLWGWWHTKRRLMGKG